VQPFGGEGPKTRGPRYSRRLATERTVSINATADALAASPPTQPCPIKGKEHFETLRLPRRCCPARKKPGFVV